MDTSDFNSSALDVIDTVAFKVGLKGYNVDEVDEFLERVSSEARQLKDQLTQMRQQLRQASERIHQLQGGAPAAPAPAPAPIMSKTPSQSGAEQVTSMIALAQQFIEQAQQEAEAKARELTVVAQERAREIVAEARSRAEDEVNRLNGLKQRLSEDVDTLSRQLEHERVRLAAVLSEFSRWLENSFSVGGARSPADPVAPSAPIPSATPSSSPARAHATEPARPSVVPPPAPAPVENSTIGQVLNFEQPSRDDRS